MICDSLPLLDAIHEGSRARLLGSDLGALLPDEKVADLFCGAGGWGEGARELGIRVDFAVNHWDVAIDTHKLNNPRCKHHRGDAWRARPREVVGDARIGLLMASAACTTHSRARGSAPISKRVHMLGWCIARWMEEVAPRVVLIENVPEWRDWGPTQVRADGLRVQDPARKGQHFRRWWRYCQRLGYAMEMRVLDAPDYGAASRRKRMFIIARNDGQPIVWPEVTHGPVHRACGGGEDAVRDFGGQPGASKEDRRRREVRGCVGSSQRRPMADDQRGRHHQSPYRTAADCIDWSDLGRSIFDRKRPLRPKTLKRIAEGIRRFVINDADPFVLRVTHGEGRGWQVHPINAPMPTQTTRQDIAVATPIVAPQNGGVYGQRVDAPGPTITSKGHQSLITPLLATTGYGERDGQAARVHRVTELLGTAVDGVKQGLTAPVMVRYNGEKLGDPLNVHRVDEPLPTVPTENRFGVVAPVMAYLNHGGKQTGRADEPMRTVVAGGGHATLVAALMLEYYGNTQAARRPDQPLGAVTTLDRHGLVVCVIDGAEYVIVDILFRMLQPPELARAMGFRDDYQWPKTKRDTVKLIGNAVSPPQARALVGAVFPRGRERAKVVA